jgi:hypothetical protein
MASGGDRPYYSGKQKAHGVNVQVVADPAGRLIWVSPALPGARHDLGAAREHGLPGALAAAGVRALADTAYQGAGPAVTVPQRRRRLDPTPAPAATGRCRRTRKTSTPPTRGSAAPANAPTPSSRTGRSSARSARAPARQRPSSTRCRPSSSLAEIRLKRAHCDIRVAKCSNEVLESTSLAGDEDP